MFLEGIDSKINPFIKYVKGLLIIILFHFFGQIPLSLYLIFNKFNLENLENQSEIFSLLPPNFGLFLILIPFLTTLPAIWYVVVKLHNQSFKRIVTSRKKLILKKSLLLFYYGG